MNKLLLLAGLLIAFSSPAQQVIAHRGAWKNSAQNSLASLREAIRLGCYGSEFDVHLSADSVPVISHDHEIGELSIEKAPSPNSPACVWPMANHCLRSKPTCGKASVSENKADPRNQGIPGQPGALAAAHGILCTSCPGN